MGLRRIKSRPVKGVCMSVHPDFYKKLERERIKFRDKFGRDLKQKEMTGMISKMQIDLTKFGRGLLDEQKRRRN